MQGTVVADMRKRIVDAAIMIAAQSGFARATTKEIAREADCSEGIIYHYFSSKNELFLAVIKENGEDFLRQVKSEAACGRTSREKLERIIDFHFHYFTGNLHIFQILFGKSADATIPFPFVLKTVLLPYQKVIEQEVVRGIRSEEFNTINAGVVASSLLGMMQLNIIKMHFGVKDDSVEEVKKTVKHLLFKTLQRARP